MGRRIARRTGVLLGLALLSSCATTDVAPIQRAPSEQDERFLWNEAKLVEREFSRSGELFEDPGLDAYLNGIAERLVGSELGAAGVRPRVRVISNVDMNAFALPNGAVYLHTAILSRIDNEAQLSALLGHEFAHVIHRHSLRGHRDRKNKAAVAATAQAVSIAAAAADPDSVGYIALANLGVQLAAVSSLYGYSRDLEREADVYGIDFMVREGYDARQAKGLFLAMLKYNAELKKQGVDVDLPPYLFSTHPRLEERLEDCDQIIAARYPVAEPEAVRNADAFAAYVEPVVVHQAIQEIEAGRLESAEITVTRALERNPRNASAWLVLGEAIEDRDDGRRRVEAMEAFQRAVELDPELSRAHRAIGLAIYRDGREHGFSDEKARSALVHFERYLELEPDAADRGYVDVYVRKLQSSLPPPPLVSGGPP